MLSSDRATTGSMVNRRLTTLAASAVATVTIGLNGYLIYDTTLG